MKGRNIIILSFLGIFAFSLTALSPVVRAEVDSPAVSPADSDLQEVPRGVSPADPEIGLPPVAFCHGGCCRGHGYWMADRFKSKRPRMMRPNMAIHSMKRGGLRHKCKGRMPMMGQKGMLAAERLLKHAAPLELTDKQINKLEDLAFGARKALIDLRAQLEKDKLELRHKLRSGESDIASIKAHLEAMAEMRVEIQTLRIGNWIDARKLLSDKQKKMIMEGFPGCCDCLRGFPAE